MAVTCLNSVNWSTIGDRKTTCTALKIWFLIAPSTTVHFLNSTQFFRTFWFQVLALGRFPLLGDNWRGCSVAQTRNASVLWNLRWWLLVWGVRASLLRGLTPWMSFFHWSINAVWSELVLSYLSQYWVLSESRSLWGIHWHLSLFPLFCLVLLGDSTAVSSRKTNQLIFWIDNR